MSKPGGDLEVTKIARTCISCHEEHRFNLRPDDVVRWKSGLNIALAFPYLDQDQQEILRSGRCYSCAVARDIAATTEEVGP